MRHFDGRVCLIIQFKCVAGYSRPLKKPPIKSGGKKRQISRPPVRMCCELWEISPCSRDDLSNATMTLRSCPTRHGWRWYPLMDIDRISRLITRRIERRRKTNRANSTSMFINRVWRHLHKLIRLLWRRHGQLVGMHTVGRKPPAGRPNDSWVNDHRWLRLDVSA